jgi:hypothetical protein
MKNMMTASVGSVEPIQGAQQTMQAYVPGMSIKPPSLSRIATILERLFAPYRARQVAAAERIVRTGIGHWE